MNHYGLDRTPDHDRALRRIKELAIEEKVDVILNTGDLFDTSYPGLDVLQYGWNWIEEFASVAPMVVVCGNHDGAKLFQLMSMIVKDRVRVSFVDTSTLRKYAGSVIHLPGAEGEIIKIASVPFIKRTSYISEYVKGDAERATVRYSESVGTLEHAVGQWLSEGYDNTRDIRIFAAHLLLDGAQLSGSEWDPDVQNDFVTNPARIPTAEYVAFGHIHKPQTIVGVGNGRYAGSPIPIDFGERADTKVAYVVSGRPGYALKIEERTMDVGRPMFDITADLETISADREKYRGGLAKVTVLVDENVPQIETRVRELLGETTVCKVTVKYRNPQSELVLSGGGEDRPERSISEMFETYARQHPELGDADRIIRYFGELYGHIQIGDEGQDTFGDLDEAGAA